MRDEQTHLVRAGWKCRPRADAAAWRSWGPAEARDRASQGEASRQRDGRAALPDARVRASETERQSGSELVVEAPRFLERPETWRTWVVDSNDAALFDGGSLHARLFTPGAVAGGMLRVPAGWAVGAEPAADPVKRIMVNVGDAPRAPGCWWRPGKARCRLKGAGRVGGRVVVRAKESCGTWRRRTAGPQHETPFGRSGVNTPAPISVEEAERSGTGMADQAAPMGSPGRAGALRRPVQPGLRPRDAARRVGAGETQPGVSDRRCRWPDPQAGRADGRGAVCSKSSVRSSRAAATVRCRRASG